jgi:hypothetical protein
MKRFKISLYEGEPEFVAADDWVKMEEADQYVFTKDGQAVAFFVASSVRSINVVDENYDPDAASKLPQQKSPYLHFPEGM